MGAFDPKCYKLHYDTSAIKLSEVMSSIESLGSIVIYERSLYIFLQNGKTQSDIRRALPQSVSENVYCELVAPESCVEQKNFLQIWFKEQYESAFLEYVTTEKQDQLKKIVKNTQKANQRITERINNREEAK